MCEWPEAGSDSRRGCKQDVVCLAGSVRAAIFNLTNVALLQNDLLDFTITNKLEEFNITNGRIVVTASEVNDAMDWNQVIASCNVDRELAAINCPLFIHVIITRARTGGQRYDSHDLCLFECECFDSLVVVQCCCPCRHEPATGHKQP